MTDTARRFAFGLSLLALSAALAARAAEPDIATRFATAASYFDGEPGRLVTDLDIGAHYVEGGKAVIFRHGKRGEGVIVLADAGDGKMRDLTTEAALAPLLGAKLPDDKAPFYVSPKDYDPDGNSLTVSVDGRDFIVDLTKMTLTDAPPAPPVDAGVVSPDGKYKVVHHGYNLDLIEIATGKTTPLTADGSYDHRYGMNYEMYSDMAAADSETPPMPVSVQWSPDSSKILTYRMDRNGSYIWTGVQSNPPGSPFPRAFHYVYPTAGAEFVPQVVPVVIDVEQAMSGRPLPEILNVPSDPLLWPGDPNMGWDHDHVIYQWTKRGYGELDEYEVDPATNTAKIRVHEAVKPVVTVTSTAIQPAPELKGDLVISERSGWAQLYYLPKGSDPAGGQALTRGNWEVASIAHVDKDRVLITGNGRAAGVNPYYTSLYSVDLKGGVVDLTPEPLNHDVQVSDDGLTFIDAMSDPVTPTRFLLRSATDGHIIAELGHADPSALLASGFVPPEPFQTKSEDGKVTLYGMIFRPKAFDAAKTYPVIEWVYTGPTTHVIDWSYRRTVTGPAEGMAQIGAVGVEVDGRGTSQRGQAFRLPAFQNMGEVGIDDHIWVIEQMAAKYPQLDLNKVGVFGHSAGSYDTARFVLRRPNFYKVGIASSGNHDLRLDKAWWPEVSMGLADDATWERNSNISVAGNLKGHLMLMHGDLDDNVPIAATLKLDKALIDAGKPHELVIIPNRTHNTYTPYFWRKHFDYFAQYLLGETPPTP
jgi:dipeptidyl aminopeptidase/acylaminoacyl peptidase